MSRDILFLAAGDAADLDAVMQVMADSFDPAFGEAWTAAQCASLLPLPGVWLTLARLEAEPAGFSLARATADEAELLLLAVKQSFQGRGIGKKLLEDFAARARARGAARLHLEVREGNHAISLYERAGYTLVGRRHHYYSGPDGTAFDALTLAKSV